MTVKPPSQARGLKQLTIVWQDSAWFPTVSRFRPPPRRLVNWPTPVLTDLTGFFGRASSFIKL